MLRYLADEDFDHRLVRGLELRVPEIDVATVGHLVAMKVLYRDEKSRPNDTADLVNLLSVATAGDLEQAREALRLIESRGCARGKDLLKELAEVEGGGA